MQIGKRIATLAVAGALFVGACGGSGSSAPPSVAGPASVAPGTAGAGNCVSGSIIAGGSTALQPLVDAAQKAYTAGCPGAGISVQPGGSGTGLTQVLAGAFQIGNSDIFAEEKLQPADASQLVDHQVVRQGFVIVTHAGVTGVTNLTTDQALKIWTGVTTNWKDVGGPDLPIVLIIRPASSGTRATFKRIVLGGTAEAAGQALTEDSNGAVATAVSTTPGATSYVGFTFYQSNKTGLNALQLDGVDASVDNMSNGTYKLRTLGHMYTKGAATGLSQAIIDYILSPTVQNGLVKTMFYAPIGTGPAATPPVVVGPGTPAPASPSPS